MARLSELWNDVVCPECRRRLKQGDDPKTLYRVLSFAEVKTGHAVYHTYTDGRQRICEVAAWAGLAGITPSAGISAVLPESGRTRLPAHRAVRMDCRIGDLPQLYLADAGERLMKIPDSLRKCVVFLDYEAPADGIVLVGTAFFFCLEESGRKYIHLVTAAHNIELVYEKHCQEIYVRVNNKAGGIDRIRVNVNDWLFHPTDRRIDVAVLFWPTWGTYDALLLPSQMSATSEVIAREKIGVGDDACMVGLYTKHAGKDRNMPIIRTGNIAAMPEEPCDTKRGSMEGYLVEIRSIGGLSGSPVFVSYPYLGLDKEKKEFPIVQDKFYLLGLMHGHWDMKHLAPIMFEIDADYLKQPLNSGIGLVVPIGKVLEIINHPGVADARARGRQEQRDLDVPSMDDGTEPPAPPAGPQSDHSAGITPRLPESPAEK